MHTSLVDTIRRSPFIRLAVPLLCGIACASAIASFSVRYVLWASIILFLLSLFIPVFKRYSFRWLSGLLASFVLFLSGVTLMQQQKSTTNLPVDTKLLLDVVVVENPIVKNGSLKLSVLIEGYGADSLWHGAKEKSLLYVIVDTVSCDIQAGQRLLVWATLREIRSPQNPEEFDYRSYMARRGCFTRAYVRMPDYVVVDQSVLSWLKLFPLQLQRSMESRFKQAGIQGSELAILLGFTLGDKELMDEELRDAFSATGLMHILAVSGLHVGLLFALLSTLLSFFNRTGTMRVAKAVAILSCLWLYASIAGFSPSVTRASIMCSFAILGQLGRRRKNTLNALAASAFLICMVSPQSLFDLGFQLSFLAVLGIITFQPILAKLFPVKNRLLRGVWQIVLISTSAQLATFPLLLHTFHQLPTYFIVANIMVLPLVSLLSYLSVFVLLLGGIPIVGSVLSWGLNSCLGSINYIVGSIYQLPYACIEGMYISHMQEFLLFLALIVLALALYKRSKWYRYMAILLLLSTLLIGVQHVRYASSHRQLAVFSVPNATYLCMVANGKAVALRDTYSFEKEFTYNLKAYFTKYRIQPQNLLVGDTLAYRNQQVFKHYRGFLWFEGRSIKVLGGSDNLEFCYTPISVDYLLVTGGYRSSPTVALSCFSSRLVILDSSVKPRKLLEWEELLSKHKLAYYSVPKNGAFVTFLH